MSLNYGLYYRFQLLKSEFLKSGREDLFPAIQTYEIALDANNSYDNDNTDIYLNNNYKTCINNLNISNNHKSSIKIDGIDIYPNHVTQNDWTTWYGRSTEEELQIHSSTIGNKDACYKSAVDRLDALIEDHYFLTALLFPRMMKWKLPQRIT